ncbi:VOC family protein [Sodalis-like symbiont of Bactericera trigonica]|nr:VOC family protein [Sodalis-like symbiont of Bactericera trigonica]
MISLQRMHHIAIIASNYARSKTFYCQIREFTLIGEHYRAERDSWKGDLVLHGQCLIELFSFPGAPARLSRTEAKGLRHLAFSVADIDQAIAGLVAAGVACEPVPVDPLTGKKYTFFTDPDQLPLELYEA